VVVKAGLDLLRRYPLAAFEANDDRLHGLTPLAANVRVFSGRKKIAPVTRAGHRGNQDELRPFAARLKPCPFTPAFGLRLHHCLNFSKARRFLSALFRRAPFPFDCAPCRDKFRPALPPSNSRWPERERAAAAAGRFPPRRCTTG
jgi:hypothetical protein